VHEQPIRRIVADFLAAAGVFEESIRQSKPVPDFARTDRWQMGLTLHGTVQDAAFVRFVEKVVRETPATLDTHDWLVLDLVAREEKVSKDLQPRTQRLLDLGILERAGSKRLMLSRRFYEFVGQKGTYTRKQGLDREQNLALLIKHIEENKATGSKLEELCQVLPALPTTQVQSLLRTLQRRKQVHAVGRTNQGRWLPGPGHAASTDESESTT